MSALQVPPTCDLSLGIYRADDGDDGQTTWRMVVDERFMNPVGVLQGGIVSTLCDSAMGATAVRLLTAGGEKVFVASAEMKVSFLRPVTAGETLSCSARVLQSGKRLVFCEAEVRDASDRLVAKASSTYVQSPRS